MAAAVLPERYLAGGEILIARLKPEQQQAVLPERYLAAGEGGLGRRVFRASHVPLAQQYRGPGFLGHRLGNLTEIQGD